jgi:hypothetical protein
MLLETGAVGSGGSVGKLQCNQQPLFRGESPSVLARRKPFRPGNEDVDFISLR